jgi:p-hydroxybenzoate 3-monooxygenase
LNLALFDVDTLAQAVVSALRDRDTAALAGYSDTVLFPP